MAGLTVVESAVSPAIFVSGASWQDDSIATMAMKRTICFIETYLGVKKMFGEGYCLGRVWVETSAWLR